MMFSSKRLRLGGALAAALLLAGCDTLADMGDTIGDWFAPSNKSKLKGERIPLNALDEALRPDATLQATPLLLPPPYRNAEWPEPGGFASNAVYHLEASGHLRELWDADAGKGSDVDSRLTASPVIGGGRIFTLDAEAHVYAFNANTGQEVWDKRLAPKNGTDMPTLWGLLGKPNSIEPVSGMGGGIAYDGGKIFATSGFGVLICMDAASGREVWRHDMGVPIVNAPVVNGGRIFFSTNDNHFYALAEADGRILWDQQGVSESAGILASTSAAVSGQFVIAPYTSGELYAMRVQNGQQAWNDVLSHTGIVTALSELDDIAARPVIDRDMVFAISHSGVMAAININTGERVWSRDVGGIQTPWAAGDFVYVLTLQNQLLCLQRKDGKVKWIHQLPRWEDEENKEDPIVWTGPVLVSDRLIVVSSNGRAYSISPYTGALTGKTEIPDGAYIPPVIANDTLYLLTNTAQLVALR
jgi:outer membrane protein assembly factor BamB